MSIDPLGAIGAVVTTAKLAWTVYKACKAAPGSFNNISAEVLRLGNKNMGSVSGMKAIDWGTFVEVFDGICKARD